ncbi:TetR/AcrR family transcriptional regulator [Tistrella mobilis]|uniref:TetR/AcrR family transcriptional regulator n=1 Tax=Tistrella mobilis TaxID=171437 RepID=UPI003558CA68
MSTKDTLIDSGIRLVRKQGYAGFSYADLSQVVGIRKPGIHHHFPAKEDLGVAMVDRYSETFRKRLRAIAAETTSLKDKIAAYAEIYREALELDEGCLCGMLASEVSILPDAVRLRVSAFFEENVRWLEGVLRADPKRDVEAEARMILGTLQGTLVVARALADRGLFENAVAGLLKRLETH